MRDPTIEDLYRFLLNQQIHARVIVKARKRRITIKASKENQKKLIWFALEAPRFVTVKFGSLNWWDRFLTRNHKLKFELR